MLTRNKKQETLVISA